MNAFDPAATGMDQVDAMSRFFDRLTEPSASMLWLERAGHILDMHKAVEAGDIDAAKRHEAKAREVEARYHKAKAAESQRTRRRLPLSEIA